MAKKAYQMFFESNLGDSGLFPGTAQLEKEVIRNLPLFFMEENAAGFVVSGGTEANLMALLAARNIANIAYPEVVLPESAHFSFTKICNLLNLKPVYAGLDSRLGLNHQKLKNSSTRTRLPLLVRLEQQS